MLTEIGPGERCPATPDLFAPMPAITLWQPWATLVAEGIKRFEFRSWPAPSRHVGKRIAIHAGARPVRSCEVVALLMKLHSNRWRETGLEREDAIALLENGIRRHGPLPLGAILCTAVLGKPIANEELARELGAAAADGFGTGSVNDSDRHQHSNWGWPLSDVVRLTPPRPARGAQGWWRWQPEGS